MAVACSPSVVILPKTVGLGSLAVAPCGRWLCYNGSVDEYHVGYKTLIKPGNDSSSRCTRKSMNWKSPQRSAGKGREGLGKCAASVWPDGDRGAKKQRDKNGVARRRDATLSLKMCSPVIGSSEDANEMCGVGIPNMEAAPCTWTGSSSMLYPSLPPLMSTPSLTLSTTDADATPDHRPVSVVDCTIPLTPPVNVAISEDNSFNSALLLGDPGSMLILSGSAASYCSPFLPAASLCSSSYAGNNTTSENYYSNDFPLSSALLPPTGGCGSRTLGSPRILDITGYTHAEPVPMAEELPASAQLTLLNPGSADLEGSAMKGWPLLFHQTHSDNIQLSLDRRRAKRFESFCKGICFSNRPIAVNERVYLKFSEVSTSWSGVVRFGVTSHDPMTINGAELPRYACPDLTNKPGYWAKAVPERFAEQSNTLYFLVTRSGDVMFGLNNEDKGLFFSGVNTSGTLWGLVDIYGNSTSMEFVDGRQLNNLSPSSGVPTTASDGTVSPELMQAYAALRLQQPAGGGGGPGGGGGGLAPGGHSQSMPSLPAAGVVHGAAGGSLPIKFYTQVTFTPMLLHGTMGRNVRLSPDKTVAVRLVEEYCNGYVFTSRPLRPGDHMVIQILSVDTAFVGGLAFGLTACDPQHVNPQQLPDDSDLLLDRPEYWVVNKDVCSSPVVGDELSFHLTEEGEVRYGKNGHHIATLMHVDKTLPLWAFFDVYGSTQKMRSLGIVSGHLPQSQHRASIGSGSGLTVALPPPRQQPGGGSPSPSMHATHSHTTTTPPATSTTVTPPPRPPPPRSSPSTRHHSAPTRGDSPTVPSLPPKQFRPLPAPPPPPGTMLQPTPASLSAVPPAVQLSSPTPPPPPPVAPRTLTFTPPSIAVAAPARPTMIHPAMVEQPPTEGESDEAMDNASNECSVCFENAVDCVLYTCGHMCVCYDCAIDIKENQSSLCPICRQPIRDIIKIYRS